VQAFETAHHILPDNKRYIRLKEKAARLESGR